MRERLLHPLLTPAHAACSKPDAMHAAALARVARLDFPNEWPDLLPRLLAAQESQAADLRVLHALHQIVKAVVSKTLLSARTAVQNLAPRLVAYLSGSPHPHAYLHPLFPDHVLFMYACMHIQGSTPTPPPRP